MRMHRDQWTALYCYYFTGFAPNHTAKDDLHIEFFAVRFLAFLLLRFLPLKKSPIGCRNEVG